MIDKQVIEVAAQAAAAHMSEMLTSIHSENEKEKSVYFEVYNRLVSECGIDNEEVRRRINEYVDKSFGYDQDTKTALAGNIMKDTVNEKNMGRKVFAKLIKAIFPANS